MVRTLIVAGAAMLLWYCAAGVEGDMQGDLDWFRAARITTPDGVEDLPTAQRDGVSTVLFHVNGLPDVDVPAGVL